VTPADALLAILAAPVLAAAGYLALLSALSRRSPPPSRAPGRPAAPRARFDVVVPAHDEARGIAATIGSLLALDYPRELYRVVVVADNCADDTAARARAAGADVVLCRESPLRGKGYALAHAFDRVLAEGRARAIVIVDADTVVSPNLLGAFAARLASGARVLQADYTVKNPGASWRTRLMTIALAAVHTLRSLARERLSLSCGLRGNGMCFTAEILSAVHHAAFSIVEDLEYGIRLGELGHRVGYVAEAHVYGDMPAGERAGRSQRLRWESGRSRMRRLHAARLLAAGLWRRDRVALDLGLDLLVPPLGTLVALTGMGLCASLFLSSRAGHLVASGWLWLACAIGLSVYGLRGWQLSGTGARGLFALLFVPRYVAWKILLRLRGSARAPGEWIRTARQGEDEPRARERAR
jgi:1,2-diacylglycerol 3-beta-glucosyltransferase